MTTPRAALAAAVGTIAIEDRDRTLAGDYRSDTYEEHADRYLAALASQGYAVTRGEQAMNSEPLADRDVAQFEPNIDIRDLIEAWFHDAEEQCEHDMPPFACKVMADHLLAAFSVELRDWKAFAAPNRRTDIPDVTRSEAAASGTCTLRSINADGDCTDMECIFHRPWLAPPLADVDAVLEVLTNEGWVADPDATDYNLRVAASVAYGVTRSEAAAPPTLCWACNHPSHGSGVRGSGCPECFCTQTEDIGGRPLRSEARAAGDAQAALARLDLAEARADCETRLAALPDLIATAIVALPISGGVTWNEAKAIGDRLVALIEAKP